MRTYLDEPFGKVWVDKALPCVFSTLKEPFTTLEFDTLGKTEVTCARNLHTESKRFYSISDWRQCAYLSEALVFRYVKKVVKQEFNAGLSVKFFIRSDSPMTRASLFHVLLLFPNFGVDVCESFEEAFQKINKLNSTHQQESKTDRSFFSYLSSLVR